MEKTQGKLLACLCFVWLLAFVQNAYSQERILVNLNDLINEAIENNSQIQTAYHI